MAIAVQPIHPVAPVPVVLGVLRRLEVATVVDRLIPLHPAPVLSCGRGVEAVVLAILDGDHALYKGAGLVPAIILLRRHRYEDATRHAALSLFDSRSIFDSLPRCFNRAAG